MKKYALVLLILLGSIPGYWLARENTELFQVIGVIEQPKGDIQKKHLDMDRIAIGMETWQVKDILGVPDKMSVQVATRDMRKEHWIYGSRCLYFTNGVLTSWQEGQETQRAKIE